MKIFKGATHGQAKLAIGWGVDNTSLLLFNGSENIKYSVLPSSKAVNLSACKAILVIPRSEVLQKEMALTKADRKSDLEAKLAQLLPYSPKDMAYSLAFDSPDGEMPAKGLLYAIPDEKIKRVLADLERSGVVIDEVVSEDQTLYWFFKDKATHGPILIFDQSPHRTLFLALKNSAILLSRVYPSGEILSNVLSEISFCLLESGIKPTKAYILGSIEAEEISKVLEIPAESFKGEEYEGLGIPPSLLGAKNWSVNVPISLLPSERKYQKKVSQQNLQLKQVLAAFGLFIFCLLLMAAAHIFFLKMKKSMIQKESSRIEAEVFEVRRMKSSLSIVHEAERSKERLLLLMKELAVAAPTSVRLKELQIEDKGIIFQGESPSHSLLAETVQVFEKTNGVSEVKLEHARLRKRLNKEFVDFEVTARW